MRGREGEMRGREEGEEGAEGDRGEKKGGREKIKFLRTQSARRLVTGCNRNNGLVTFRPGLQFVVYKTAEQEWSFVN